MRASAQSSNTIRYTFYVRQQPVLFGNHVTTCLKVFFGHEDDLPRVEIGMSHKVKVFNLNPAED